MTKSLKYPWFRTVGWDFHVEESGYFTIDSNGNSTVNFTTKGLEEFIGFLQRSLEAMEVIRAESDNE